MRVLTFGIDHRALLGGDGHSKRWNARLGGYVDRLDVFVELRDGAALPEKAVAPNVNIIPLRVRHPLLYSWVAYREALRRHAAQRYDLVTAEDPFRPGLAAALFSRATGVPASIEYHTDCFNNPQWIAERPLINRAYHAIGKAVVRRAASVRCVNGNNLRQLRAICGAGKTIEVIPVPTVFYEPDRHASAAARIREEVTGGRPGTIILFVGRLAPVKRVDELIDAFAALRGPRPDVHLVIVGEGSERPALEARARQAGAERIRFTGYIPEADVFGYYGAADLFVNPAHLEPYGRVYIEAMSAGVAVVTRRGAGAVDDGLCIDGETALVTASDTVAALHDALAELLDDPTLRRRLGQNGERAAREKFNYESSLKRIIDFWKASLR